MEKTETNWEIRMRLQKERHEAETKVRLAVAEYERAAARETDFLEKMWEETRHLLWKKQSPEERRGQ